MNASTKSTAMRATAVLLLIAALVAVLAALPLPAAAAPTCTTDCYVDPAGDDTNDGTTPATALKTIQAAINQVSPGGVVHVLPGTYAESPNITKSLTLQSTGGRDVTTIDLQPQPTAPTYLGALMVDAPIVTVDGFTIEGFDADCAATPPNQTQAASNLYVTTTPDTVVIKNNRFKVGQIDFCSFGDDGVGIGTYYTTSLAVDSLTVENNIFVPVGASAFRAFYVNPGTDQFIFRDNQITGDFTGRSITQAADGLVEGNTVTGSSTTTSRGLGTWGYPDPSMWGATHFTDNTISGTNYGIIVYETENVTIDHNTFNANGSGVLVTEFWPLAFDISTIHINRNSFAGQTADGVANDMTTDVDAVCNWWNAADGPSGFGPGSGDAVSDYVLFDPWLTTDDLDAPCFDDIYLSTEKAGVVGVVAYGPEDILEYDVDDAAWSLFFDGSAFGLTPKHNVTVIDVVAPDDIFMSLSASRIDVPGVPGKVTGNDILHFDGAGFTMYFDGSDVGLTGEKEKIDALAVLDGSVSPIPGSCQKYFLISLNIQGRVPGVVGVVRGEDILGFCATNLGSDTAGFWHVFLDGSTKGLPVNAIKSLSSNDDATVLYFTVLKQLNIPPAVGGHSMVFKYDVTADAFSGPYFSAPAAGLTQKVDAMHVETAD